MSPARTRLFALCGLFVGLFVALAPRDGGPGRSDTGRQRPSESAEPLPPGAVARLGSAGFRHPADVTAIGTAADGATVYSTAGGSAFAWDIASGRQKWRTDNLAATAAIREVGDRVLVGPNPTVELSRRTGRVLATWYEIPGAFDLWPEAPLPGRRFVYCRSSRGAPDGAVSTATWDLAGTGEPIRGTGYYIGNWQRLFSPDGEHVAIHQGWRTHSIYSTTTGARVRHVRDADEEVYVNPLAFTPDGRELIACHEYARSAWAEAHPVGGGPSRRLFPPAGQHWNGLPEATRVSADGRWVAVYFTVGNCWELWDRNDPRVPTIVQAPWAPPGKPWPGEFTRDGSRFVTVCGARQLAIYDAATGSPVGPAPLSFTVRLRWTADGQLVALSNRSVARFEPLTGRRLSCEPLPAEADSENRWFADLSRDGATVAYPTRGHKTAVALDLRTGARRPLAGAPFNSLASPVLSPDGAIVAISHSDGTRIVDAITGAVLREPKSGFAWHAIDFTPDGRWLVAGSHTGGLQKWDTKTGESRPLAPQDLGRVEHLACGPDGRVAAVVETWERPPQDPEGFRGIDASVHVCYLIAWDANTGRQLSKVPLGRAPSWAPDPRAPEEIDALTELRPTAVAWLIDGRTVAVGGERDRVHLIDTTTGRRLRSFGPLSRTDEWSARVSALAPSPDGRYLAAASSGGVLVWDLAAHVATPITPSPR